MAADHTTKTNKRHQKRSEFPLDSWKMNNSAQLFDEEAAQEHFHLNRDEFARAAKYVVEKLNRK